VYQPHIDAIQKKRSHTNHDRRGGKKLLAGQKGNLKKNLNLADLFFLGIGSIIGSGWLFGAQKAASTAGTLSLISWFICAGLIILVALVYAELGAALPRAGGFVRSPNYSHGSFLGFLIGFFCMIASSSVI